MLRNNCKSVSMFSELSKPGAGVKNGWAWRSGQLSDARGGAVVLDVLRNSARTYRWETLTAATTAVSLKLALPRDLAACAIVSLPKGAERLEVVTKSMLIRGDARELWNRAKGWHQEAAPRCNFSYPAFTVVRDGEAKALPACLSAQTAWVQDALSWINRSQLR